MQEKEKEGGEMFYSHYLLSRKGPLGTIWIAAHCFRKLRKQQVKETDISSSIDRIMLAEVPIAFRIVGFLLIGVVRVYSKKVEYLYHDCNEALFGIKTSFVPRKTGPSKEAPRTPPLSITLPERFELDAFNLEGLEDCSPINLVRPNKEITLQEVCTDEASWISSMEKMLYYNEDTTTHHEFWSSSFTTADDISMLDTMDIDLEISGLNCSSGLKENREKLQSNQLHLEGCLDLDMFCSTVEPLNLSQCFDEPNDCGGQINWQELLPDIEKALVCTEGNPLYRTPSRTDQFPYALADATPEVMLIPTPSNKERERKSRKRKRRFDQNVVLSNEALRQGLHDTSSLVRVRRRAPHTALDSWKANKISNLCQGFLEPLIPCMSSELKAFFTRIYFDGLKPKEGAEDPTQSNEEEPETVTRLSDDKAFSAENDFADPSTLFMSAEAPATSSSNEVRSEMPIESGDEEPPAIETPDLWLDLMDEDISSDGEGHWNQDRWSMRTRTVAQNLHNCFSKQEGKQKEVLSVACLLEGRTRRTCARLFYETLVLKSEGYIDMKQDSPYADILLLPTPQIEAMY